MTTDQVQDPQTQDNVLKLRHFDYIELYVGNPHQAAHFYRTALGFTPVAYAGLETGARDFASFCMTQGNIRLVLTGPLTPASPINQYIQRHGDSVRDIAFEVADATAVFEHALRQGATPVLEPTVQEDRYGRVVKAAIGAYGDTIHSFVQRDDYTGPFLPLYKPLDVPAAVSTGIRAIDHVAVGIEPGKLNYWVEFYKHVLSFHEMHEEMVTTENSAMNSKVVEDSTTQVKFPLVEPIVSDSPRRSQIDEYLSYHDGPGAQHLAFLTDDIVATITAQQARGIEFLPTLSAYYDLLPERVPGISAEQIAQLRAHNVLVDKDEYGTLMQIFSRPIQSRPTLFIEIVQRNGARGFGSGNIRALFQAVEYEQMRRGTI